MSTAGSVPRKLSSFLSCKRCRTRKVKCEPCGRKWPQKCALCEKSGHDCDPGEPSLRAQRARPPRSKDGPQADGDDCRQDEYLAPYGDSIEVRQGRHRQLNRRIVPQPCSWQQYPAILSRDDIHLLHPAPSNDEAQGAEMLERSHDGTLQRYSDGSKVRQMAFSRIDLVAAPHSLPNATWMNFLRIDGLHLVEPSNHRVHTRMTHHLEKRMQALWGNYKIFANTKRVSDRFSRTVSEFFSIYCRQMAREHLMVWEALNACGAADALMNKKLVGSHRLEFETVFNIFDRNARKMMHDRIKQVNEQFKRGESPELLPLYYTVFLLHASSACVNYGLNELSLAMSIFKWLDSKTASFPLQIRVVRQSDQDWTVRMLLANDKTDPGMEIRRSSFLLGKARAEFDTKELHSSDSGPGQP